MRSDKVRRLRAENTPERANANIVCKYKCRSISLTVTAVSVAGVDVRIYADGRWSSDFANTTLGIGQVWYIMFLVGRTDTVVRSRARRTIVAVRRWHASL